MKRIYITALMVLLFSTTAFSAITGPSSLTNTVKTNTTLTLTWDNEAVADSIMIYINDAWVAQLTGTLETYQATGLTPGTTYTNIYAIADSAGVTANSDTLTVQVHFPRIHGPSYASVIEADLVGIFADSWASTLTTSATLAGEAATDSTAVIIPFNATTFQCNVAGDSVAVKIYFYGGKCNGPYYVTLQDSLEITEAGVHRKELNIGPDPHAYALFAAQANNGLDQTVISDILWTLRRSGSAR